MAEAAGDPWSALRSELDRWAAAGRTATLWWRDDDAVSDTPALTRLRALADGAGAPVGVAAVPERADASLAAALAAWPGAAALQHGWAHRDHARPGEKRIELGGARDAGSVLAELAEGARRMRGLFGPSALPVLVPPWNRIAPEAVARLPEAGFRGLSVYGPRPAPDAAPGVLAANAHADVIDWRARRPLPPADAAARVAGHLAARRTGAADPDEPTGLLTHHLVHDEEAWDTLARLVRHGLTHPAVRWLHPREIFGDAR
jgi:hypothetical protein